MTASPAPSTGALAALHEDLLTRWPESMIEPSLDRISRLMELLGDPQRTYPVIHVAGTNGKTSTARMIESLLRTFGLRTGLYTSPHLTSITERVLVDGEPISAEQFVEAYQDIAAYVEIVDAESLTSGGPAMSYFEVVTGLALAHFADVPVDVAVIEVGMGGRWDATNVVDGAVAVVTPIDLDHADYLGTTLTAIATEKAGIIKPGCTAVLAAQQPEAAAVLLARCVSAGVEPLCEGPDFAVVGRDLAVGGQVISLQTTSGHDSSGQGIVDVYPDIVLALHGAHQASNAAAALTAVEAFLTDGSRSLDVDLVREACATVTSPGRLEVIRRSPTVIVDAAHNPHGAQALALAVAEAFTFSHLVGVIGVLSDKDALGILVALESVVDDIVVTKSASPRAMSIEQLAELAESVFGDERVTTADTMELALDHALARADDIGSGAGILVTGSVVTAAEVRRLLKVQS